MTPTRTDPAPTPAPGPRMVPATHALTTLAEALEAAAYGLPERSPRPAEHRPAASPRPPRPAPPTRQAPPPQPPPPRRPTTTPRRALADDLAAEAVERALTLNGMPATARRMRAERLAANRSREHPA